MRRPALCLALCALALLPRPVQALDKQGSAHGGAVDAGPTGFNLSGAASFGVALYNPTYAARPDNSGTTLLRYALHLDTDILGPALSFPLDLNLFTDRQEAGGGKAAPSELDVIAGVTTTQKLCPGALELGLRLEHDRPVDRGGFTQTYVDVRMRYLFSLAEPFPALAEALSDGDVNGWLTLGAFTWNPTYAARPDNTGKALLRYAAHVELSLWSDLFSIGLDGTMFTDRERKSDLPFAPSELDLTAEVIGHQGRHEVHVAYERDLPLDREGLVQHFVYALYVVSFDLRTDRPAPLGAKHQIPSP